MVSKDEFDQEVQSIVGQLLRLYQPPEEVEQRLSLGDPFLKSILEEGRVLYEAA